MDMKHTPGPWELRGPLLVTDRHGVIIAERISSNGTAPEDNARLIAAAPDMLSALRAAEELLADNYEALGYTTAPHQLRDVRAAIAKATGGAS